jgi:acid stress-induced BolA-like protein IbaG/YrbA
MKKIIHLLSGVTALLLLTITTNAQSRGSNNRQSQAQQAQQKSYTPEEIAKIMDKKSYPDYDADKADIDRIYALYNSSKREGKAERLEKLAWSKQRLDEVGKKYGEYWQVYWQQVKQQEPMGAMYQRLKTTAKYGPKTGYVDVFEAEVEKDIKRSGNPVYAVPQKLSAAQEKAKGISSIFDKSDFKEANYDGKQKQANSAWTSVTLDMQDIDWQIALAKYQQGADNNDVKKLLKNRDETEAAIEGYKKDFDTKLVSVCMKELAAIKQPAEVYAGADKEQLRKAIQTEWKKGYCKDNTLVKIIFTSSKWDRDDRRVYENASNDGSVITAHNESDSYLNVSIIYKDKQGQPEILDMWEGYIDKDNKGGGFTWHICPEGGYFPKKILAKNVK